MVDYLNRADYVSKHLVLAGEKVFENMVTSMFLCYPKKLLRKVSRVNLENSPGSVGVAVNVDIKKPLVEYPNATFAGVLDMNRINVPRKTLF